MFLLHFLLYFSILCKHLCNCTYWWLFCLFFPRIPSINTGSLTALCVSNIFFMLPWQFAQFVLLTQVSPYLPLNSLFVNLDKLTALYRQPLNSQLYQRFPFSQISFSLSQKILTIYHINIFLDLSLKVAHLHHLPFCVRTKNIYFSHISSL